MREMDCVFVAVDLHCFAVTVILVSVVSVTTGIDGPHVPLGFTFGNPFGQHLTSAAALSYTKGKYTPFISVFNTRHRAHQRQAIRRIWNWTIDHPANPLRAQDRYPCHGILNIPLQPLQIIWIELETEIFRHWIFWSDPMGFAIALIGAKVQAIFILTKIIRRIDIP